MTEAEHIAAVTDAVLAERMACAVIASKYPFGMRLVPGKYIKGAFAASTGIAKAIRSRGSDD